MKRITHVRLGDELDSEIERLVVITDFDKPDLIRRGLKAGLPIVEQRYGMATQQISPRKKQRK